jgi:DNA-binding LacI/PurR family transcriptional regulator
MIECGKMNQQLATDRSPNKTKALADAIRDAIAAGEYAGGDMLPSEREFMLRHDLSRTTVRRAIQLLVDEGYVYRRAGSGSFVSETPGEPVAQPALRASTPTMSLIIPTFSNPLYAEMIDGIEREAREHGLKLITNQSGYSLESESRQLSALADDPDVRGAVVVPVTVDASSVGARRFLAVGKPLVFMGRWPDDAAADGVSADYLISGRIAVEHLLAQGHKRIAYVEGSPHLPGFSLLDGYSQALQRADLPIVPELVRINDLPSEAAGRQAIEDLLSEKISFSAVFARNDVTALGVVQALRAAGVQIPGKVAVASVNDSLLARSMDPPLTSVHIYPEVLGRMGFRLLHDRMTGNYDGPQLRMTVVPSLIVRASTAATGRRG